MSFCFSPSQLCNKHYRKLRQQRDRLSDSEGPGTTKNSNRESLLEDIFGILMPNLILNISP
jgi:hypothetical protein